MKLKTAAEISIERADTLAADSTIPPMTDPQGQYWSQPDRRDILLDEFHAVMSSESFARLLEYSASQPTGVYVGKMWKRHDGVHDLEYREAGGRLRWLLCWYGNHPNPGYCTVNYREILLLDDLLPA